jgi:amidase
LKAEAAAFTSVISIFAKAGATIVPDANFTALEKWTASNVSTILSAADFNTNLAAYLAQLTKNPTGVKSLADVRNYTKSNPAETYPDRDVARWDLALDNVAFGNTDPRFWPVYQEVLSLLGEGGLLGALERHDLDAVIMPASFSPSFAAGIGAPIVTVPLGFYPGDAPVRLNARGNLVNTAPHVPQVTSVFLSRGRTNTL